MATATARAPQPGKKKGRPVAGRPLAIHVSNDIGGAISLALQLQRLLPLGIIGQRAHLIAGMAWGEESHG